MIGNWLPTMLFNIALPIVTFSVLTSRGMGNVPALVLSGVWPLVELVISYARTRHADEFSIMILIFLVVGIVASLAFNSARLLLIKDSAVTGLFGIVLLASLLFPRPLMFYFGRKFATDGTPEKVAWWNGLWQYEGFRRGQRILTIVWGLAFLGEAVLRIVLSYILSTGTMVVISNTLPYAVLATLIFGTISYGKRRGAAARAAATPPQP
jgi:intracellular septation protein A